jgi:hypothetical protein
MRPLPILLTLLALAAPALGEIDIGAHRVVRLFDFEERAITTEPVPTHWVRVVHQPGRVELPGFPAWNRSGFDASPYRGAYSAKLPTRGGSAALRLAAGVAPVVPQADYVVTAAVRTEGLDRARARIVARFLDGELREILASEQTTDLIRTDGAWTPVAVELWGDEPEAAWIQIDLQLLQPSEQPGFDDSIAPDLRSDDLSGAAWFDEVAILQVPRVELTTNDPMNVIALPEAPELRVRVRDLTGELLRGEVVVRDIHGRTVARRRFDLPPGSPPIDWRPELPALGWYEATLRAFSGRATVGETTASFVWARGETPDPAEAPRFTVLVEDEPIERLESLPALLKASGVGGATVTLPDLPPAVFLPPLEGAVMAALESRFRLGIQLSRLPGALARRLHIATDDLLAVSLDEDADAWRSFLEPTLARFGQRVQRWQIGDAMGDLVERPDLLERREAFREAFMRLSPEPVIATPWAALRAVDPSVARSGALTIAYPTAAPPEGVGDLVRAWEDSGDPDVTLILDSPEAPLAMRARQLALRTIHAWLTGVERLCFPKPWAWSTDRRPQAMPTPELGVIRSLAWRLHGRELMGRLPVREGAHALVLHGAHNDTLAVWNEHADPRKATLEVYLGGGRVRAFDLFGNPIALETARGKHRIDYGFDPIFIENVDGNLLRFQSGVRIEPGFLTSEGARRTLELVVRNPWPESISGRVRLSGKEHWRLAPRVQQVTIDPGGELRLPFEVSLGVAEESGEHAVRAEFELNVGRAFHRLDLAPTIEIGLENVVLEGGVRLIESGDGKDVLALAIVTNVGSEPVTMTVSALAPGFPRKQAPISALAPGASAVRQFRFERGGEALSGRRIRLSLVETDGAERLNRTLDVP